MKDRRCHRTVYDLNNKGEVKHTVVSKHHFAYSGSIPCTGPLKCIYCGRAKDEVIEDSDDWFNGSEE